MSESSDVKGQFAGKVALVTGAGGGIGLAAAQAFARHGATVILADINVQLVQGAATAIVAAGGRASAIGVDVTDFGSCQGMVAHARQTFGGLHIAFNNAGIGGAVGCDIENYDVQEWSRVIATNVTGMFLSMKAEVPALKASGGGVIVNTASVTSFIASPGMAAYGASKHAVAGLTKAAALELIPHGIRVNALCPGMVDTPMLAHALSSAESRAAMTAQAPIGRIASAEEIADVVIFLASDKAKYMVGSLLLVDGAQSLG